MAYLRFFRIEDAKSLLFIGEGILFNLFRGQDRTGDILIGRIPNESGEIADLKDDVMP